MGLLCEVLSLLGIFFFPEKLVIFMVAVWVIFDYTHNIGLLQIRFSMIPMRLQLLFRLPTG
jgi:hypothetical protein